jgi:plastocyanin
MSFKNMRISFAMMSLAAIGCLATLGPTTAGAAEQAKIIIKDFMYAPMSLTVRSGTTVTWVNMDDEPHTVVSDTGLFRSGGLDTNETFSYTFDKQGSYRVTCSIHPRMVATVVVE